MIICLCNGINEAKVDEAIEAGARTPIAVHFHHGVQPCCGQCLCFMQEKIEEKGEALPTPISSAAAAE